MKVSAPGSDLRVQFRPKGAPMGFWRDCCDPTGQITVTAMPHPHAMASVFRRQRL